MKTSRKAKFGIAGFVIAALLGVLLWSSSDTTPELQLWKAAAEGDVAEIRSLLKSGTNINANNNENQLTALHLAVSNRRQEAVEELVRQGADVNAVAKLNMTPVGIAFHIKNNEAYRLLVEHGADPTSRTRFLEALSKASASEIEALTGKKL